MMLFEVWVPEKTVKLFVADNFETFRSGR